MKKILTAIIAVAFLALPITAQAAADFEKALPDVANLLDEVQTKELLPEMATLIRETPTSELAPEMATLLEGADLEALTSLQQIINQQLVLAAAENWEWTMEKQLWLTLQTTVSALALGIILIRLMGRQIVDVITAAKKRPAWSFFVGLLGLIAFLLVPLMLMIQIGSFIALAYTGIWLAALAVSMSLAGLLMGSYIMKIQISTSFQRRLLVLLIGTACLAGLSFIPVIGPLLVLVIAVTVLGAFITTRFSFYKSLKKSKLV